MKLNSIVSASHTETADQYIVTINADIGNGDEELPFMLVPGDKYGLSPAVRAAFDQWLADGNEPSAYTPPPVPEPAPITEIHKAWFRAALADLGHIAAVDQAVASSDPISQELWASASTINRNDAGVNAIASALGIDLDAVFARAVEIRAQRTGQ